MKKIALIFLFFMLFSCTSYPDIYEISNKKNVIEAHYLEQPDIYSNAYKVEIEIDPSIDFELRFRPTPYWYYYNKHKLHMNISAILKEEYYKLRLKEVTIISNSKEITILKDKYLYFYNKKELYNEKGNNLLINNHKYYIANLSLNKSIKSNLLKGLYGEQTDIKLKVIYNFNDNDIITKEIDYVLTHGGFGFDIFRPIVMFFPP